MKQVNGLRQRPFPRLYFLVTLGPYLALLAALLVGCSKPALDKSLLTDDVCMPPCWSNLTPGESTEEDVLRELGNSPYVRKGSVKSDLSTAGDGKPTLRIVWADREYRRFWNRAILRDNQLVRLEIFVDYRLTFEEVVGQFGPPERVHAHVTVKDGILYMVWLDYPSQGLRFVRWAFDPKKGEVFPAEDRGILSPGFLVTEVDYYVPNSLEGALQDPFLLPANVVEQRLQGDQAWEGFGEIRVASQ